MQGRIRWLVKYQGGSAHRLARQIATAGLALALGGTSAVINHEHDGNQSKNGKTIMRTHYFKTPSPCPHKG
jgi:hypothetical protein